MTWSDADGALAKQMWADGNSASTIASELPGKSRNAVIGYLSRHGGALIRRKIDRSKGRDHSGSANRIVNAKLRRARPSLPPPPQPPEQRTPINFAAPSPDVPASLDIAHGNLTNKVCHWRYCTSRTHGATVAGG